MSRLQSRTDILSVVLFAFAAVVPTVAAFQSDLSAAQSNGSAQRSGADSAQFAVEDDLRLSGTPAKVSQPAGPNSRSSFVPTNPAAAPAKGSTVGPAAAGDLKLGGADPAGGATANDDKSELGANVEPIRLKLEPKADVAAAWDAHFAAHTESGEAVRATVRQLMKEEKPDQCAAVVMSAIKHKQAQPWMYEALGLAMELQGARVSEIERALMSAVDFSSQPDDLLKVADYMLKSNLGGGALQRRALDLYRQVAKLQPWRQEPYICGLHLAQHLDDVEGLKWSTLGIVSQAWPREQRAFAEKALNTAEGLVARLKAEKKLAEAEKFQTALNEAKVRDCVITVSWSGDADIDLTVDEPTGAVCSYRNPRSTGGGVLIDDSFDKASGLHTETYVCPQGFNGDYRILAKRVWGKVIADTLSVAIVAHKDAPNERRLNRSVKLKEDKAIISFDLQNGRRTESLTEHQVVNAVKTAMAGNQILAQQLAVASDPTVRAAARDPRLNPGLFLRGSVGYQPIIITLPTGTNMSATAVVSHDRRYVRISAQPVFSTIPVVNTFNYQSGSSGTSGGATNANGNGAGNGVNGGPGGGPGGGAGAVGNNNVNPFPVIANQQLVDIPPVTNGLRVAIAPWYGWYRSPGVLATDTDLIAGMANYAAPTNYFASVGNFGPRRFNAVHPGAGTPGARPNTGDIAQFNNPYSLLNVDITTMQSTTALAPIVEPGAHVFMFLTSSANFIDRIPQLFVDGLDQGNGSGFRVFHVRTIGLLGTTAVQTFTGYFGTNPAPGGLMYGVNLSYVQESPRILDFGYPSGTNTGRYGLSTFWPPVAPAVVQYNVPPPGGNPMTGGYDIYAPFNQFASYRQNDLPIKIGSAAIGSADMFPAQFNLGILLIYDHRLTDAEALAVVNWINSRGTNLTLRTTPFP